MQGVANRDCRDRPTRRAEGCGALRSADADVVIRHEPGRDSGVPAIEVMRRSRRALDGAIVAL